MNDITYRGRVTIEVYKGDTLIDQIQAHNAGTSELFRYMANCMVGNFNQALMPRYIHTFYVADTSEAEADETKRSNLWTESASTCALNVPFSSVDVREGTRGTVVEREYIAQFSFMIPYSQFNPVNDVAANVICLYNTNTYGKGVTPLAYIILKNTPEKDERLKLSSAATNVLIKWELSILNDGGSK